MVFRTGDWGGSDPGWGGFGAGAWGGLGPGSGEVPDRAPGADVGSEPGPGRGLERGRE